MPPIPFNRPSCYPNQIEGVSNVLKRGVYESGPYVEECLQKLKEITQNELILLTTSCTAALEISALLYNLEAGDEVIMPSYTFVSTANAFVLRGVKPVFVDIDPDTLSVDPQLVQRAITSKTKGLIVMNYAGACGDLEEFVKIARENQLFMIEDAAQSIGANYKGVHLGNFGDIGCFSFHYTKNLHSGFGGAIVFKNKELYERAKILIQRGTNRDAFLEGQVDKYSWVDVGSSYVLGELNAATLLPQLQQIDDITKKRKALWQQYHHAFERLEKEGLVKRPRILPKVEHNAHIYYLILNDKIKREEVIRQLNTKNISLTSHYQPLHTSQLYLNKFAYYPLPVTETVAMQIIRLPLYVSLSEAEVELVCEQLSKIITNYCALA